MTVLKKKSADAQFAALGIPESAWTPAMRLAVKQRWSSLPVDETVDSLRHRLADVTPHAVPEPAELAASDESFADAAAAEKEIARLKRNAAVNAWRERTQLQAALDARGLKFAGMRGRKKEASA